MNGVAAVMLVVLGLAAPLHTPDLQVEVVTGSGTPLSELAEAVSRALVAGGSRVVLRGPTSGSCEYCALVKVIESAPGVCDVEVRHEQRVASTRLHLPAGSQLFDRARAIAIQARLLMTWQNPSESKAKDVATRPAPRIEARASDARLSEVRASTHASSPAPSSSSPKVDSVPYLSARREPLPPLAANPVPVASSPPSSLSPFVVEPPPKPVEPSLVSYTARGDGKPAPRPAKLPEEDRTEATRRRPTDDVATVQATLAPSSPRWPWIPTAIGAGAAVAAGICASISRGHYNALADKGQPIANARSEKSAGERWQTASLILAGVAVVGVGAGLVGFSLRSSDGGQVTALATPIPGGGMVAIAGNIP